MGRVTPWELQLCKVGCAGPSKASPAIMGHTTNSLGKKMHFAISGASSSSPRILATRACLSPCHHTSFLRLQLLLPQGTPAAFHPREEQLQTVILRRETEFAQTDHDRRVARLEECQLELDKERAKLAAGDKGLTRCQAFEACNARSALNWQARVAQSQAARAAIASGGTEHPA